VSQGGLLGIDQNNRWGLIYFGGDINNNITVTSNVMNNVVNGLQGRPLSGAAPTNGQAYVWNGSNWSPTSVQAANATAGGDLNGTYPSPTVAGLRGNPIASATAPLVSQALVGNGSGGWVPGHETPFALVASTAPSQTAPPGPAPPAGLLWVDTSTSLSLSGPAGGDLSGTYPDPTVSQIQGHGVWNNTPTAQSFLIGDGNGNWGPYNLNIGSTSTVAIANRGAPGSGFDLVVTDSGWQALALNSPWTNFGAPYRNLSARLIGRTVHLDALISPSAAVTGQSTIATLPTTMYPACEQIFWVSTAGSAWIRLDITTSGAIEFNAYGSSTVASGAWVSLSGITWLIG
jgi:hypothetical protein